MYNDKKKHLGIYLYTCIQCSTKPVKYVGRDIHVQSVFIYIHIYQLVAGDLNML